MLYLCLKGILTYLFTLLIHSFLCSHDDPRNIKSDLPKSSILTDELCNSDVTNARSEYASCIHFFITRPRERYLSGWQSQIFLSPGTGNKMSKYNFRQPSWSQSECDLWDVNHSPRVTNVKSQRKPNSAPGSQLKAGSQIYH